MRSATPSNTPKFAELRGWNPHERRRMILVGDTLSRSDEGQTPTKHKAELAARLKQLRAEHGLSLSQLARATGISSSFLSLIEQAQSDITIGRLVRLAEFYDVELGDLLSGQPSAPGEHVRILRAAPDHMLHSPSEGVDVYDLSCGARWTLVPILSSFRPGGSIEIDDEHEHERMIYILDGTFELIFPDEPPTRLRNGEGATFNSIGRYRLTNVGRGPGRLLAVRLHPETH
jgi:transcriptional regulator with XRE-family HTH domain